MGLRCDSRWISVANFCLNDHLHFKLSDDLVAAKLELIVILMVVLLDLIGLVLETLFEFFIKGFESLVADLLVVDNEDNRQHEFIL